MAPEPLTPLVEAALMQKEMFDTYLKVGFSEDQALKLIAYMTGDAGRNYSQEDSAD